MKRILLPPVSGITPGPSVEDHVLPPAVRALFIRIALAAPAAKAARGEPAYSPAGLAASVWHRLCNAYEEGPGWEKRIARDIEALDLIRSFIRPDDLLGSEAMIGRNASSYVLLQAQQLLGHDIGLHDGACPICAAADREDWEDVLDRCGRCPRALWRDLRLSLLKAKRLDADLFVVPSKPVDQYEGIF